MNASDDELDKRSLPTGYVRTWDELMIESGNAREAIGKQAFDKGRVRYRGVDNSEYTLVPKAMREDSNVESTIDSEATMFEGFKNEYFVLREIECRNNWDHLYAMQHHGLPTRLPDWTESWKIALCFALEKRPDDPDSPNPAIRVVNPYHLNNLNAMMIRDSDVEKEPLGNPLLDDTLKIPCDYHDFIRRRMQMSHEYPIAIGPPGFDDRAGNRLSCFTFHGNYEFPLEELEPEYGNFVQKMEIDAAAAIESAESLELDLMDYRMFPDSAGLSMSLKRRYSARKNPDSR